MSLSRILVVVLSMMLGATALSAAVTPASAADCPDVKVVFARGTFEPPGVGATGQAFVDSLRAKSGSKSVDVYAVDYPASLDFAAAASGVLDAGNVVRDTASTCPRTDIVIGGYSQGAAVAAYLTEDAVPEGFELPPGLTGPLPPAVAKSVAAVTLFGKPSTGFLQLVYSAAPPITIGSRYTAKTIDLCNQDDPVCSPTGRDRAAHSQYAFNGMTDQAADFAAART
jgi:cutinase